MMSEGLMRENDGNGECGEVVVGGGGRCGCEGVGVGRWMWVGKCECDKQGCDVGGCGRWVQVMECVKIKGVEREGVRKRVCSHTHIDILHLLCTSLTLSSKYCTQYLKFKFRG